MLRYSFFTFFIGISVLWSQNTFKAIIKEKEHKEVLVAVSVSLQELKIGSSSDENGFVEIKNIPNGSYKINFKHVGFEQKTITILFPNSEQVPMEIYLEHHEEEADEVIVSATRSSRTIADNPTRVEAISGEELSEKGNMKPGDIRMLLNESTGIQTQQTSAISFNSSIRIQGLDGKYTQILKDGYPLYGGFSGGLSLLQIVPLDLKQVEVIKGASSTLYGAGAIAGLVNLVSKRPTENREINVLLNGTSALGLDASAYYAKKNDKFGSSFFVSYNAGTAYDPADIGLTAIPEFRRYTINPKLYYYYNDRTSFEFGLNTIIEDRTGGDVKRIENKEDNPGGYFERNKTTRLSGNLGIEYKMSENSQITIKNSVSYYDRNIEIPDYKFSGEQLSSFTEAVYRYKSGVFDWVAGLNFISDRFTQNKPDTTEAVDHNYSTFGAFLQNTWSISEKASLESGLRFDHQNRYGSFVLPRLALLFKLNSDLSFRLGGGMGYKTPTIFTEDAERIQFRDVQAIDVNNTHAEESIGINTDINFRTTFLDDFTFNINALLFYTRINDPIVLSPTMSGSYTFNQPNGFIDTKGLESNIKLTYDHLKLFVGYTYANVQEHYEGIVTDYPLVAKHRLNNVLMYEKHDNFRIGLEAYYFSPQKLNNGQEGEDYLIMGLMTEKMWHDFSIFLNFENFLDTRQTKFGNIFTGPITKPIFNDIYAPIDGFVVNGGVKVKF